MSVKSVPTLYILEMVQNYEEPRNTCLIISRNYFFKGIGEIRVASRNDRTGILRFFITLDLFQNIKGENRLQISCMSLKFRMNEGEQLCMIFIFTCLLLWRRMT